MASRSEAVRRACAVLARRRKRLRLLVALAAAVLLLGGGAFVGARAIALSREFPDPPRERVPQGASVSDFGQEGVTVSAGGRHILSEDEVRELCPGVYEEYRDEDARYRLIRTDLTVSNNGTEELQLFDLRSSVLTIGSLYGNSSCVPAEAEAFPDPRPAQLAAGQTVTLPFLFMVWDYTLTPEMWDELEQLPMGLQISMWPKVVTLELN